MKTWIYIKLAHCVAAFPEALAPTNRGVARVIAFSDAEAHSTTCFDRCRHNGSMEIRAQLALLTRRQIVVLDAAIAISIDANEPGMLEAVTQVHTRANH